MTADQRAAILGGSSTGTTSGTAATWTDFVATNPTPGTPIVFAVTTAYSATAGAYMAFQNGATPGASNAVRTYIDHIKLLTNVVPASSTSWQYALYSDVASSNRYTSGGSAITPINPNAGDATAPATRMYAGALVTAAASGQARLLSRGTLRGVVPTIFDEMVIQFGAPDSGGSYASAAASGRFVVNAPVVSIDPQQWLLLHMWGAANGTAGQFEFEVGFWESPVPKV